MFQKYVEIGRVAIVNYGELAGKACHILEVLDENRVCTLWLMTFPSLGEMPAGHRANLLPLFLC